MNENGGNVFLKFLIKIWIITIAQSVFVYAKEVRIHGRITNPQEQVIVGAEVQLTNQFSSDTTRAVSNTDGYYSMTVPITSVAINPSNLSVTNGYQLYPNYPNPFNLGTSISFELPRREQVRVEIYNVLGLRIRHLTERYYPAGQSIVYWDGHDDNDGKYVSVGIYFYRLITDRFVQTRKTVLLDGGGITGDKATFISHRKNLQSFTVDSKSLSIEIPDSNYTFVVYHNEYHGYRERNITFEIGDNEVEKNIKRVLV